MNIWDIVLGIVLTAAVCRAVVACIRRRRRGGCCGCGGNCSCCGSRQPVLEDTSGQGHDIAGDPDPGSGK